jgi:hypothetical protein
MEEMVDLLNHTNYGSKPSIFTNIINNKFELSLDRYREL